MEKKDELFKEPRWNEYQSVKVLNVKVKPTKEDEKNADEFVEFIKKKIEEENKTKKENK